MNPPDPGPLPSLDASPARRRWLKAAIVSGVLAGGAGIVWRGYHDWRSAQQEAQDAFWNMELITPQGAVMPMSALLGKPLLLNFWATWCPPCIEEMPLLSRFYSENASNGWQVLGLAVDKPESVRRFLARSPVSYPVAMAGTQGMNISQSLGNVGAALPFTVVLDSGGHLLRSKIGQITPEELVQWTASGAASVSAR